MSIPAVRKAVIPAAGLGTRFLPATKAVPKEMLAIVDKPALQYVVEEAVRAGLRDVLVVTGRGKVALEDHFDRSPELEHHLDGAGKVALADEVRAIAELADLHYLRQGAPLGLGHAVAAARHHVGDEPFAVLLPDDLMATSSSLLADLLAVHARTGCSVIALTEVPIEQISSYGCVRAEPVGAGLVEVLSVVEKPAPAEAPSNLAIMGRYVLTPQIFACFDRVKPGAGGELQLTDAIAELLSEQKVFGVVVDGGRYDIGDKLGYLAATVELALDRPDLGPPFRRYLADLARRGALGDLA